MALPDGLHALEPANDATELLVGVHGFGSRGYEWVYPLQALDTPSIGIQFYRWDYDACPQQAAEQLQRAIEKSLTPQIRKIHLVGHSYGGILLASVLADWRLDVAVDIHVVAAPLKGTPGSGKCSYQPPTATAPNVSVFQWRTRHELDGAFKRLAEDPQNHALEGSSVTRLPTQYHGNRLGHNRSLSWVADRIVKNRGGHNLDAG